MGQEDDRARRGPGDDAPTARGTNRFNGSGHARNVVFDQTGNGDECASFVLHMRDKHNTARVRINVYGGLVRVCRQRLVEDGYVVVDGQVMNRERLTEVRAEDLAFP